MVRRVHKNKTARVAKQRAGVAGQRGGKHIFSGTYGCGYSPAIRCAGETDREPGVFSKLMTIKEARKEMVKRELLQPIDPDQKYFLYPLKSCRPDFDKLDPVENDIDVCSEHIEDFRSRGRLLQFRDGGENLLEKKLGATDLYPFFRDFGNLFKGLMLLQSSKIAHLDIKPANIVCKRKDSGFDFRFIDFGFTVSMKEPIPEELPIYANYPYWPYEVKILDPEFVLNNLSFDIFADTIFNYLERQKIYSKDILDYDYTKIKPFMRLAGHVKNEKLRSQTVLMKADIYSLGVTLVELFTTYFRIVYRAGNAYILTKSETYIPLNSAPVPDVDWLKSVERTIARPMYELLRNMMNLDYSKRFHALPSYTKYMEIVAEMGKLLTPEKIRENLSPFYEGYASASGGRRKTRKARH